MRQGPNGHAGTDTPSNLATTTFSVHFLLTAWPPRSGKCPPRLDYWDFPSQKHAAKSCRSIACGPSVKKDSEEAVAMAALSQNHPLYRSDVESNSEVRKTDEQVICTFNTCIRLQDHLLVNGTRPIDVIEGFLKCQESSAPVEKLFTENHATDLGQHAFTSTLSTSHLAGR